MTKFEAKVYLKQVLQSRDLKYTQELCSWMFKLFRSSLSDLGRKVFALCNKMLCRPSCLQSDVKSKERLQNKRPNLVLYIYFCLLYISLIL
jgi:hypothetical protein